MALQALFSSLRMPFAWQGQRGCPYVNGATDFPKGFVGRGGLWTRSQWPVDYLRRSVAYSSGWP